MTTPSDPQAAALSSDELLQWVSELRERADALMRRLAAAGLVIAAPDALASRPDGDRAKIDWTNDPITRSDIKKWQRALYDLRQTYYHPGIGMYPPYYRRCRAANLQAIRYLRLTGDHNPPLVTPAPGPGSEADHA